MSVCIVVPCYNESQRLPRECFEAFLQSAGNIQLLFVDDGSRDDTPRLLDELCQPFPSRAAVLHLPRNGGKGEAVRQGMLHAIHSADPELIGFWDADLATPLETIERLVRVLHQQPQLGMVFGSRVMLLGRKVERDPLRHYLGRVFATVASTVLELPIYDTQCGAKIFRVGSGLAEVLREPFSSKWVFDVEIIARYRRIFGADPKALETAIFEYPLETWHDIAGSKVRPTDFLTALVDLLRIRARYFGRKT